jgi:hypothetical protein
MPLICIPKETLTLTCPLPQRLIPKCGIYKYMIQDTKIEDKQKAGGDSKEQTLRIK